MRQTWAQTLSYCGIRLQRQGDLDTMCCQRPECRDRLALPHKGCCWMEGKEEHCGYGREGDSHVSHTTCVQALQPPGTLGTIIYVRKPSSRTISELERSEEWAEEGCFMHLWTLLPWTHWPWDCGFDIRGGQGMPLPHQHSGTEAEFLLCHLFWLEWRNEGNWSCWEKTWHTHLSKWWFAQAVAMFVYFLILFFLLILWEFHLCTKSVWIISPSTPS